MKILIEVLAVFGACAVVATLGMLTLCWLCLPPSKNSGEGEGRYEDVEDID